MELWRPAGRATRIVFPILDFEGNPRTGASSLDSEFMAWADTGPAPGNNFADCSSEATEIGTTGIYTLSVAAAELPAASPYVMIRIGNNVATQYMLIQTASVYANVTGINGTNIAAPVTAGYMPVDVKQTINITAGGAADNSVEKALARTYFATAYVDAAVSSRSAPATAQTINQTTLLDFATPTDNNIGKVLSRLYHATQYLDAAVSSRMAAGNVTVGTVDTAAITAASFAAGAIDAAALAANAIGASELNADVASKILETNALTEAYPADGATATPAQLLYLLLAALSEFAVSSTTVTVKKLDGTTTAATYTLDDATNPTSRTRAT